MLQPQEVLQLRDGAVEGSLEGCNHLKKTLLEDIGHFLISKIGNSQKIPVVVSLGDGQLYSSHGVGGA